MFLGTTGLVEFWKKDEEILFLGMWCLRYERQYEWKELKYCVLPYPWDNKERLEKAYKELESSYENILNNLVGWLNRQHNLKRDSNYWRIVIGPWLYHFLAVCQVARLEDFLARRRTIAARYHEAVRQAGLTPPWVPAGLEHGYFRYVVRLSGPVGPALDRARALGIGCSRPVFRPIHRYLDLSGFPESDAAWERALSIPLYPALTDHEVDRIVGALPAIVAG